MIEAYRDTIEDLEYIAEYYKKAYYKMRDDYSDVVIESREMGDIIDKQEDEIDKLKSKLDLLGY